jgi:hypothetical protein
MGDYNLVFYCLLLLIFAFLYCAFSGPPVKLLNELSTRSERLIIRMTCTRICYRVSVFFMRKSGISGPFIFINNLLNCISTI